MPSKLICGCSCPLHLNWEDDKTQRDFSVSKRHRHIIWLSVLISAPQSNWSWHKWICMNSIEESIAGVAAIHP